MFALFRDSHDYFNRLLRVDIIRWEKIERDASGDNKNDVRCLFIARETSRRRGVMHFWQGINLTTNRALFRSTLYSLGIIVSFIMVHLIKAHARLYGCVSRESRTYRGRGMLPKANENATTSKRATGNFRLCAFAENFAESLYNARICVLRPPLMSIPIFYRSWLNYVRD